MTTALLCAACGTQFADTPRPPERCPLCEDSRAFGRPRGERQRWISLAELGATHCNRVRELEPGVISIATEPQFGVGQHCLLVLVAWEGARLAIDEDLTLVHCAGHFPGSAVLHAARRGERPACLFAGDTINVLEDQRNLSFMHNYPKHLPLPAEDVRKIAEIVEPLAFERVYGCWPQNRILRGGRRAVLRSADRHIRRYAALGEACAGSPSASTTGRFPT